MIIILTTPCLAVNDQQVLNYVKTSWGVADKSDAVLSESLDSCTYSGITYKEYVKLLVVSADAVAKLNDGGVNVSEDWTYVSVTGICSCQDTGDEICPVILLRKQSDIVVY